MPNPRIIVTKRTFLRRMEETDLLGIYETHADSETRKYTWINGLYTQEQILLWIKNDLNTNNSGLYLLSIIDKENAAFLGLCGLRMREDLGNQIDIAYRIHPNNRLNGIATETAKATVDWAFQERKLDKILAQVHSENLASQCIMRKLNFELKDNQEPWWVYEFRNPFAP